MHPAPSIIVFTTLSGIGFGLLIFLGLGLPVVTGWLGFVAFGTAFSAAVAGLVASTFHLGHPERALLAFTQWRSSWLSREAWLACGALVTMGLFAAGAVLFSVRIVPLGWIGAAFCFATIGATSMMYGQLKTVPRWRHWTTPPLFFAYGLGGGALLAGQVTAAIALILLAGALQVLAWYLGDKAMAETGSDTGTATGLWPRGKVRAFESPHTGANYLTREMVFVLGRKRSTQLRIVALALAIVIPVALLLIVPGHIFAALAIVSHVTGVLVARWLFFAEAEHVVGLFYGAR
jgi:sulfite dehydrogenase (quinone) subunit SoeC